MTHAISTAASLRHVYGTRYLTRKHSKTRRIHILSTRNQKVSFPIGNSMKDLACLSMTMLTAMISSVIQLPLGFL